MPRERKKRKVRSVVVRRGGDDWRVGWKVVCILIVENLVNKLSSAIADLNLSFWKGGNYS